MALMMEITKQQDNALYELLAQHAFDTRIRSVQEKMADIYEVLGVTVKQDGDTKC
jgi:hypothetical protein